MDLGKLLEWMAARGVQLTIAKADLVIHLQLDARCGGQLFRVCRFLSIKYLGEEIETHLAACLEDMLAEIEHREIEVPIVSVREKINYADRKEAATPRYEPKRSDNPDPDFQV